MKVKSDEIGRQVYIYWYKHSGDMSVWCRLGEALEKHYEFTPEYPQYKALAPVLDLMGGERIVSLGGGANTTRKYVITADEYEAIIGGA